jgi:hypothetical protein
VLAREWGGHAAAARLWAEVLAECPGDPEALAMLRCGAVGRADGTQECDGGSHP